MQRHDPARNILTLAQAGFELAGIHDIEEAHALVESLVAPPVACPDIMRRVQAKTGAGLFIMRQDGRITAVIGELALTPSGLHAVQTGAFDGLAPASEHLCAPGNIVSAMYCWGAAAATRRASAASVRAVVAARETTYADLPFFTRAAQPKDADANAGSKGAHAAARRFGCTYYPGQPNLLYSPGALKAGSVAA